MSTRNTTRRSRYYRAPAGIYQDAGKVESIWYNDVLRYSVAGHVAAWVPRISRNTISRLFNDQCDLETASNSYWKLAWGWARAVAFTLPGRDLEPFARTEDLCRVREDLTIILARTATRSLIELHGFWRLTIKQSRYGEPYGDDLDALERCPKKMPGHAKLVASAESARYWLTTNARQSNWRLWLQTEDEGTWSEAEFVANNSCDDVSKKEAALLLLEAYWFEQYTAAHEVYVHCHYAVGHGVLEGELLDELANQVAYDAFNHDPEADQCTSIYLDRRAPQFETLTCAFCGCVAKDAEVGAAESFLIERHCPLTCGQSSCPTVVASDADPCGRLPEGIQEYTGRAC